MTHDDRMLAAEAIRRISQYLQHPDMPVVGPEERHNPLHLSDWLERDARLVDPPGQIPAKQRVMNELQYAADYLSHPRVRGMRLSIRPTRYAEILREIVRDLKPRSR